MIDNQEGSRKISRLRNAATVPGRKKTFQSLEYYGWCISVAFSTQEVSNIFLLSYSRLTLFTGLRLEVLCYSESISLQSVVRYLEIANIRSCTKLFYLTFHLFCCMSQLQQTSRNNVVDQTKVVKCSELFFVSSVERERDYQRSVKYCGMQYPQTKCDNSHYTCGRAKRLSLV